MTLSVCVASSLVGDSISACTSWTLVSMTWHTEREIMEVLPVPDWAWAMTSRPVMMGMTARCWMAEGFSKP